MIYPIKNKITYLDYNTPNNIDYYTYSIDTLGCKDIDDAIHIKKYVCAKRAATNLLVGDRNTSQLSRELQSRSSA